ncbi:uncharacterized protein PV09_09224 [Verruconis gallopava]|uniref:Histone chaperone domain-containing protein n=1 Tax=Verruconis gallopava TaxID=253628 RepID=A0A0D1ZX90_9PEZI|nr:uncharacterized protein PV09_09224 [Verruconis gallopava]KIV99052.1 hypothetical protein PV09_09224 [Verruconis gallopava]
MADQGSTVPTVDESSTSDVVDKGKGKSAAPPEDDSMMDEEEDDDEEDSEPEHGDDDDEEEDDEMEAIDMDNIVSGGRRTRGKIIDFAKAAEENKDELDDDDEEDDEDFEVPDEEMED